MKNACCVVQYLYQSKSVCKADWYLESLLADKVPIRPDRERMLSYQAFYIWWFFTEMQPQKITACPAFEQRFWPEVLVETEKEFLENIIRKFGTLLIKSREGGCIVIKLKVFEQFMFDRAAFHGNLEMEECVEREFPVTGKIHARTFAEIFTVLVHFFNFGQKNLLDFFRVCHESASFSQKQYNYLTKGPPSLPFKQFITRAAAHFSICVNPFLK